ncbi:TAXI family TRAP transporter solute-binding subunit [Fodinicurvata sp. EGI_FJ10296]|uniref:TAXI family TRAP transporter solute-binding subunit n=1 Tax=Fodinicurvata sp. EGI_FJ10296 TaxID=3231908 RepID=UPI00345572DB
MAGRFGRFVAAIAVICAPLAGALTVADSAANDLVSFRIGTGGSGGTYFPIGRSMAEGISSLSMSSACDGRDCPPSILAVAQTSNGSVANIESLAEGGLEGGFAQANIVHWAHTGTGMFDGEQPHGDLRAIANLYPEAMHLVTAAEAGITGLAGIEDHRISLDEPGSGTLVDAQYLLAAFEITDDMFNAEYMKADLALERMAADLLDGFFAVAGPPLRSLIASDTLRPGDYRIVPIDGAPARRLLADHPFYTALTIPGGTYPDHPSVETVGIGAQFITHARLPDDIVYEVTRLLWAEETQRRLSAGHRMGGNINLSSALEGLSIPLHPGAARFYREHGLID